MVTSLCSEGFLVLFDVTFYDFLLTKVEFIKSTFVVFFTNLYH